MSDLFFGTRTTAPGQSDAVGRPIPQFVFEFVPAPPNRFGMQAGDLGDPLESTMPEPQGLAPRHFKVAKNDSIGALS